MAQHERESLGGYTARRCPVSRVWSDSFTTRDEAFAAERKLNALADCEQSAELADVLAALPERLRLVLQLYFVEELNLPEIAAVLGVSVPRVHQLKADALKRARQGLEGL